MTAANKETQTGDRQTGDRKDFALKNLPDEVTGQAREIWLAGLGALQRLEQEGDKVFETLVERGKQYEDKRRDQIEDATDTLRDQQQKFTERLDDATESVEKVVSDTLRSTLGQIGVPTRDEVRGLSRRVGKLSKKLDALSEMLEAQQTAAEAHVFHVAPNDDGWIITVEGEDEPVSEYGTKKEAVSAARSTAKEQAPSELVVHKQDRSVQESFSYGADDEDADDE